MVSAGSAPKSNAAHELSAMKRQNALATLDFFMSD
jgi:hypothetical protein